MKTEELCPEKKNCCGCGACINICPQNAIRFNEDKDGFLYPEIDEDRCINCLKCKKICAFQNQKKMYPLKEPMLLFQRIQMYWNPLPAVFSQVMQYQF